MKKFLAILTILFLMPFASIAETIIESEEYTPGISIDDGNVYVPTISSVNLNKVAVSKTATNLNTDYESDIMLKIPTTHVDVYDIVFVVDASLSMDSAADNLLQQYMSAADARDDINVGIVYFYGKSKIYRQLDGTIIAKNHPSQYTHRGTNLNSGILTGTYMLDNHAGVSAANKYLIILSDGDTHVYQKNNQLGLSGTKTGGETVVVQEYNGNIVAGPDTYLFKYGTYAAPANWYNYFVEVAKAINRDGDLYEQTWGWDPRNYYNGAASYITGDLSTHAVSSDKALYYAMLSYADAQQRGYNCYAVYVDSGDFSYRTSQYAQSFMNYLNCGRSFSLSNIGKEISYVTTGSYVTDYMGSGIDNLGNEYDMDFIPDASRLYVIWNGERIDATTDDNITFHFDDLFTLVYNGEEENDYFKWIINTNLLLCDSVELHYSIKLSNPQTAAGEYGEYDFDGTQGGIPLLTNTTATLYTPDNTKIKDFPLPAVEYSVTPTPSPTPTITPTETPTSTPSPTPVITESPTPTPIITETPSPTPIITELPSPTSIPLGSFRIYKKAYVPAGEAKEFTFQVEGPSFSDKPLIVNIEVHESGSNHVNIENVIPGIYTITEINIADGYFFVEAIPHIEYNGDISEIKIIEAQNPDVTPIPQSVMIEIEEGNTVGKFGIDFINATPTPTPTITPTITPTEVPTDEPTPTISSTPVPTPTETPTEKITERPIETPSPTPTVRPTPTTTATRNPPTPDIPSIIPTNTPSPTPRPTPPTPTPRPEITVPPSPTSQITAAPIHPPATPRPTVDPTHAIVIEIGKEIIERPPLEEGQPMPKVPGKVTFIIDEYDTPLGVEVMINHVGDCFD